MFSQISRTILWEPKLDAEVEVFINDTWVLATIMGIHNGIHEGEIDVHTIENDIFLSFVPPYKFRKPWMKSWANDSGLLSGTKNLVHYDFKNMASLSKSKMWIIDIHPISKLTLQKVCQTTISPPYQNCK